MKKKTGSLHELQGPTVKVYGFKLYPQYCRINIILNTLFTKYTRTALTPRTIPSKSNYQNIYQNDN